MINTLRRLVRAFIKMLRGAYPVLTGRRFDITEALLRDVYRNAQVAANMFIVNDSIKRLQGSDRSIGRLAVLSPVPPAKTGIANCTLKSFEGTSEPVDIFSVFEDPNAYFHLLHGPQRPEGNISFYDSLTLPMALSSGRYNAVVVAIGNSEHNLFAAEALSAFETFGLQVPLLVHIHDPCLLHLWQLHARRRGSDIEMEARGCYQRVLSKCSYIDPENLIALGCLGVSAIIGRAPVSGIVVNSSAAHDMVNKDLQSAGREIPIFSAFHPVFTPPPAHIKDGRTTKALRIGTFGVPGHAKMTDHVYEAVEVLRGRGIRVELLVAGYGAAHFSKYCNWKNVEGVQFIDAPSDNYLYELMAGVDVAVQLRRRSLGENSGVIPQLLSVETPVIASRIGAFVEYGDAVVFSDPGVRSHELALQIINTYANNDSIKKHMRNYVSNHTASRFRSLVKSHISSVRSRATDSIEHADIKRIYSIM